MEHAFPSLKKIPLSVAILIFAVSVACVVYIFWGLVSRPPAESVFWETIEGNLNTGSVVLETEVATAALGGKVLAEYQMSLGFAYETEAYFSQQTLLYDEDIAEVYVDPQQIDSYSVAGFTPPAQEWYEQEFYTAGATVYGRHDLYTNPEVADWRARFNPYFAELPLNEWRVKDIGDELPADFQQFLLSSLAHNNIFFYGRLGAAERAAVVDGLKRAYVVDFEQTNSYSRAGRLLYEYEVGVDYRELGIAFFEYWRANIADAEIREQLAEVDGRTYFSGRPASTVVYTVVIDARARQIVTFSHPYELIERLRYYKFAPEGVPVEPYFAPVGELLVDHGVDVDITTKVLAQGQRLSLVPPCVDEARPPDCSDD